MVRRRERKGGWTDATGLRGKKENSEEGSGRMGEEQKKRNYEEEVAASWVVGECTEGDPAVPGGCGCGACARVDRVKREGGGRQIA
jgi:hypothetical protein